MRLRLLEQVRQTLRSRHYSRLTEQTHCQCDKRFIYFHKVRYLAQMAEPQINAFQIYLAVEVRPATHLLEDGYDFRNVHEFLGRNDAKTTMVCTHALNWGCKGVCSPPDGFWSRPVNKVRCLQKGGGDAMAGY